MDYVTNVVKSRKIDRRVMKTKNALFEAFDRLTQKKDYAKISVSELAREADIDRKTFYLHYSSIEDMVDDRVAGIVENILDEVELDMQRRSVACEVGAPECEYVKPDARVFFASVNSAVRNLLPSLAHLLGDASVDAALDHIGRPLAEEIKRRKILSFSMSDKMLQIHVSALVGFMLGAYGAWFKGGMAVPLDEIFDMSGRLIDVCIREIDQVAKED